MLVFLILFSLSALSQSTMVVLQALSEYMINKPPTNDLNLDVDVKLTGRKEIRYRFNPRTAYAARSSRVRHGDLGENLENLRAPRCIRIF